MVKSSKKQARIPKLYKKHKTLSILAALILTGMMILGIISITRYIDQRAALKDLTSASNGLKTIYDNLLSSSSGNVASTYFGNDCSVGNSSWLEQRIACGPSGNITLKAGVSLAVASSIIDAIVEGADIGATFNHVETGKDSVGVSAGPNDSGVRCYIDYGQNMVTDFWSYDLVCRKDVSEILPGYTVKQ